MKKKEVYICEACGEQYDTEEECRRCESIHIKPVEILKSMYPDVSCGSDRSYPVAVEIKMEDGRVLVFRQGGRYK